MTQPASKRLVTEAAQTTALTTALAPKLNTADFDSTGATKINSSVSAIRGALNALYEEITASNAAAASTQRLLAKMKRGYQSASIAVITDSTGGSSPSTASDRWPYKIAVALGAMFPKYTVNYYAWDPNTLAGSGTNNYGSATLIQTGTGTENGGGPFVLSVYNLGVGNSSTDYAIGNIENGIGAIQPDVTFIAHGHNEQHTITPFITTPTQYKGQMFALTETVLMYAPRTSIIIVGQNPDPLSTEQAVKADEYQLVAEARGFGYINIYQAFIDYGDWQNNLMATPTDKHPNVAGQQLITDEVMKAFTYRRNQASRIIPQSGWVTPTEPLNFNHDFSVWSGSSPVGYRLSGAATNKNFTNVDNDEVGYSCRITATGAAPSYIEFRVPAAKYRGRPVNVSVRLRLPGSSPATAGSVQIGSQINSNGDPTQIVTWRNARSNTIINGKWVWVNLQHNVVSTASWVVVRIYADTANNASADISVQRVILTPGILPYGRSSVRLTALPTLTVATPTAIPGVTFAWEADAYTGTYAHGASITQLTDQSGNAYHATQATSTKRATMDTSTTMNSKATAKFTAANNQFYVATGYTQPAQVTQYVVFKSYVSGSLIGNQGVSTNAQSQEVDQLHLGRNPSDRKLTYPSGTRLDAAGNHLLVMRYDYTDGTYEAWLDGALIGARDPSNTVLNPAGPYLFGAWRDTSSNTPLEGNVGGFWIASRLHTDVERRGVQDMLAARFGVTLLDRV